MTDEERYARGLERLELWKWTYSGFDAEGSKDLGIPDVRHNPAFAWRVWKAVRAHFGIKEEPEELLYRQVCLLGDSEKK